MTPIYASDRSKIENWYAYRHPDGRRVFWDGGLNRSQAATGFWCPVTGNIVDVPDSLVASMPPVCLAGQLQGGRMIVTGFPHATEILPVVSKSAAFEPVAYFYEDPQARASFCDEVLLGPSLLGDSPCEIVKLIQLPGESEAALEQFRSLGEDAVARHPWSVWTANRSCHLVANHPPKRVDHCRVREIVCDEQLELIDHITVWETVERLHKIIPMYPGDDAVDCDFWEPKRSIALYMYGDTVVGYE